MRRLRWSITAAAIGAIIVKDADVTMIAAGATMMMVIIGADIERNRCGAGVRNPAPLGPPTRV